MLSKVRRTLQLQLFRPRRSAIGAPPGVLTVDPEAPPPRISVVSFGPNDVEERVIDDVEELATIEPRPVLWVNVEGLGDLAKMAGLQKHFDLHALAMEDVVNTHQRPKAESYEEQTFIVLRAYYDGAVPSEQVAMFVGEGYVVTFQERRGDPFEPVRERIRHGRGRIRGKDADYLAYALIDAIVDAYFPTLEELGDRLEELEVQAFGSGNRENISGGINELRWRLLAIRRSIWPLRDVLRALMSDEIVMFSSGTHLYLRDCADHIAQALEHVETYQQMASTLMDGYLSHAGHRMNEIMKVLTIIATIIPLGFLVGLYGMNFDTGSPYNMPELGWRFGYPTFWLLLLSVVGGMLFFFRRKGWLGG